MGLFDLQKYQRQETERLQKACIDIKKDMENIRKNIASTLQINLDTIKLPDVEKQLEQIYILYAKSKIALDELMEKNNDESHFRT